jgi:hypothetical protein
LTKNIRKGFLSTYEYDVKVKGRVEQDADTIHIATAVCGQKHRAQYALPLIKSAIVNSESRLDIHLFTTSEPRAELESIVHYFKQTNKFQYQLIFLFITSTSTLNFMKVLKNE